MLKCEREKCPIGFRFSIDLTPVLRSLRHWSNLCMSTLLHYPLLLHLLLQLLLLRLLLPITTPLTTTTATPNLISLYYVTTSHTMLLPIRFLIAFFVFNNKSDKLIVTAIFSTGNHDWLAFDFEISRWLLFLSTFVRLLIVTNVFNWSHLFIYTYRILAELFWYPQDDGLNIVSNRFIWTKLSSSPACASRSIRYS